jgi:biopolymer transport protein ExbD
MRLSRRTGSHRVMMNITPLIDIVFLLIIFFVTVSQITEVNEEKLDLPKLKGEHDQSPVTIVINVNAEGKVFVASRQRTIAEAVILVGNELAKVGDEPSLIRILVRHDRNATSKTYNELLRQFKQLNITQVRYSVESG